MRRRRRPDPRQVSALDWIDDRRHLEAWEAAVRAFAAPAERRPRPRRRRKAEGERQA